MKIQATPVFQKNWDAFLDPEVRIIANQGSTRSSKTYSVLQVYIFFLLQEQQEAKILSIVRGTLPAIKKSIMRDFVDILTDYEIYDPKAWRENTYRLNGHLIEFFSTDQPQKVHGAKRNYLLVNEANEISLKSWRQLSMRTSEKLIIDYNPSDEYHWIYEQVLTRDDCAFIHSTYRQNPFLPQSIIDEIESYKDIDDNYWRVYGLGERGVSEATVYTKYMPIEELPENFDREAIGVDFGWNNPSAMVHVRIKDDELYWKQIFYASYKSTKDMITTLQEMGFSQNIPILCDHEMDRIMEFQRAGFRMADKADKTEKITKISEIQQRKVHITKNSTEMIKEYQNYKFKVDKEGVVMDDVVKVNDHALDAAQYACTELIQHEFGRVRTF